MNEQRAQQLVVGSVAATAMVSGANYLVRDETPGMRWIIGVTGSAIGLAIVAMFAPQLAAGLAVLLLATTVFVYGGPVWEAVSKAARQ